MEPENLTNDSPAVRLTATELSDFAGQVKVIGLCEETRTAVDTAAGVPA
jgi:hypothetical protein